MEFHVSRAARDRYQFDDALFSLSGHVVLSNLPAARDFAQRINAARPPDRQVLPAQLNAVGLLDELVHALIAAYREEIAPGALRDALNHLRTALGEGAMEATLTAFADQFPTVEVYRQKRSALDYLRGSTDGVPNAEIALEEMLVLWLTNQNPAVAPYKELFDDRALAQHTHYREAIGGLEAFFDALPPASEKGESLLAVLRAPFAAAPDSVSAQLAFVAANWTGLIARGSRAKWLDGLLARVLSAGDYIREEDRWILGVQQLQAGSDQAREWGAGGLEASAMPPRFDADTLRDLGMLRTRTVPGADGDVVLVEPEPERFTPDRDWMPRLVMMAKSTYVWLDQLSRKYQRAITRLDQIPDEELDQLQGWGITGLWLIGLWERSAASRMIKQLMGNTDAVASAYSLHDYRIAEDLGGDPAMANLRERAWQRGIRMGSDMVPNHMGIDSAWMAEHPDWWLQLDAPPYPGYTFMGPDLSRDSRISVRIEDHYWNRTDAAVVFKVADRASGRARYVYHGNDGTSTPWNDTAQLNYLLPEVREAVIQVILQVARQFPIIRFDAAMTLAKRHIQRLWFPQPGQGGAIPSRSEHGMTRAQLDALMPQEFWREVVDRCAVEAPDTLLLAEAFWMMEGYFVRTLGMHRVYNSAFMIMLRDEKNAGYRAVIKDTLAFDPQILRRYVNFMNNPDEKTAAEQFGKGAKYFGIAAMLATLPGLPMFGHGQFEGFTEKYGMEFKRAMRDEEVDWGLREHHERVIVPLLKRRALFADVEHFVLFDFESGPGINEDVFAYSNRYADQRALVVFNNRDAAASGAVRIEAEIKAQFEHDPEEGDMRQQKRAARRTLAAALGLSGAPDVFLVYRDQFSGLEHICSSSALAEQGFRFDLAPYECRVLLDAREVRDGADGGYAGLEAALAGRGVGSIEAALREHRESTRPAAGAPRSSDAPLPRLSLVVHATHEAGIKVGGIGAVLDGLLSAPSYTASVARTILVGPMRTSNVVEMERLFAARNGVRFFYYFADRGLSACPPELALRLSAIERDWGVRICYARRAFGDAASGAEHEILLLDASDMPAGKAASFKFGVWERFGLDCRRYENIGEFNDTLHGAPPAYEALRAVLELMPAAVPSAVDETAGDSGGVITKGVIVSHEFMGLPLWYAAELAAPGVWSSAYVAHEVPSARAIVEQSSGHDTRFYNALREASRFGLSMDDAFGDQSGYFKHAMVRTAAQCDRVLAVGDMTAEELRFVDRRFRRKGVSLSYNGVPARHITLEEKRRAMRKIDACAFELAGFEPTYVFTHVGRLAGSKAFWRDIGVMRQLDPLLAERGESAVLMVVASSAPAGRPAADAQRMARTYGWPTYHRVGWPDLVDNEVDLWRAMVSFNAGARASRIVLVNQFGFDGRTLGGAIPDDVTFADLRQGTDLEFGQSIYEPFGIAQLEPLTYGALCVVSNVCGCVAVASYGPGAASAGDAAANLVVADYTSLPYPVDLRGALSIGQWERDEIERRAAWDVAATIIARLPRSDDARQALLESGYALAARLSWDVVARDMFLPGIV